MATSIIKQTRGKTLWTGTASSGNITVPDTDKYITFIIMQAGEPVLALKKNGVIRGVNCAPGENYFAFRGFAATYSGNTWDLRNIRQLLFYPTGGGSGISSQSITEIIGLTPEVGG